MIFCSNGIAGRWSCHFCFKGRVFLWSSFFFVIFKGSFCFLRIIYFSIGRFSCITGIKTWIFTQISTLCHVSSWIFWRDKTLFIMVMLQWRWFLHSIALQRKKVCLCSKLIISSYVSSNSFCLKQTYEQVYQGIICFRFPCHVRKFLYRKK